MGLFDFLTPENGSCSECEHKRGDNCDRFHEEKYDRVNGTTYIYDSCATARSSSGFCGHKGKYWEKRDTRSFDERNQKGSYTPTRADHYDENRGNW